MPSMGRIIWEQSKLLAQQTTENTQTWMNPKTLNFA